MARKMPISTVLLAFCMGLLVTACSNGTVETESHTPVPPASMFVEHMTPFCGSNVPDKFTAGYFGSNPLDTTIYFYIVCHSGDTIYRDKWPGTWMLTEDVQGNDSTKIAHIHASLHKLVRGSLASGQDTLATPIPENQRPFGYYLGPQHHATIYYSLKDHQVHKL